MELFDLRPYAIIQRFGLQNPIFQPTATYGHFGRDCYKQEVEVFYKDKNTKTKIVNGQEKYFKEVEFFAWEKVDYVEKLKKAFDI
jgi:S-adenosylmethionine synthetase